jgi:para-aminobenzoate synthetase component 1
MTPSNKLAQAQAQAQAKLRALAYHYAETGDTMLLETQYPFEGNTFLAAKPRVKLISKGRQNQLFISDQLEATWEQDPWEALEALRQRYPGWFFCTLGYELITEGLQSPTLSPAHEQTRVPGSHAKPLPDPVGFPDLVAFQPEILLGLDTRGELTNYGEQPEEIPKHLPYPEEPIRFELTGDSHTREEYTACIEQILKDIYEGEYYELNLSHQLQGSYQGRPEQVYEHLAHKGPVPMAVFARLGELKIVCASPERYLKKQGSQVTAEPIKGTRPRSADPVIDQQLKQELLQSEKERAENLMIVDLVRHDLSQVAIPGSVEVPHLFECRSYATVHQLVSTVRAQVASSVSPVALLKACFPAGSMTGAPKGRVLEYIQHYEKVQRGLYSGAIGYLNPEGDIDFNVVIRTALIKKDRFFYATGGAITSDADPLAEWEETWTKTRAILSLGN